MITELSVLVDCCTVDTMPSMAALHALRHANYQLFLNFVYSMEQHHSRENGGVLEIL